MSKFIGYLRVSTDKQGIRGLGIEAQRSAIIKHIGREPDEMFVEVESGAKNHRIELSKAIAVCLQTESTLVIAKLDRLSRNLLFICELMESKVKFIACDMPHANDLTIHIIAAMAQQERKLISERTKTALAIKLSKGDKLGVAGKRNISDKARANSIRSRLHLAKTYYDHIYDLIEAYHDKGMTLQQIADKLNRNGYKTRKNKRFTPSTIHRVKKLFINNIC